MADLIVVTWDRQTVCALQRGRGEHGRVAAVWTAPWPEGMSPTHNATALGTWLRDAWQKAGLLEKQVWLVVPREDVVLRHLELPKAPDDELPDLVRFQASSRSSVPLEQSSLDFIPLSPLAGREGRDVLAATYPKAAMENLRTAMTVADKELVGISFSSQSLGEWGEQIDRQKALSQPHHVTDSTLVMAWDGHRVELSVVCGRELTFAHAARAHVTEGIDPTPALLAEVSRTLVAGQRLRPGLKVTHGWLVGGPPELAEALAGRLECTVEPVDPFKQPTAGVALKELEAHPVLTALLLGTRAAGITPNVNFIKPRQPPPRRDPRKQQIAVAAAAALLVLFFGSSIGVLRLRSLDAQIALEYSRKQELDTRVKGGKPALDAGTLINEWDIRNINQLKELVEIEGSMPGGLERPYLSEYEFTVNNSADLRGHIAGWGSARTRNDVTTLQQQMVDDLGYQVFTKEVTSSRDPQYTHRYTLDLNIPKKKLSEPPKGSPNPAAPAKTDPPKS